MSVIVKHLIGHNMYLILILVLVAGWLYKRSIRVHSHFSNQGLPNLEPVPVFGNLLPAFLGRESTVDLFNRSYNKFKQSR